MKRKSCAGLCTAALAAGLTLALTGCGETYDGPPRAEVFGTVTWQGQPVDGGTINFFPAQSGSGRNAGATIVEGKYRIDEIKGPEMGQYKVLINWGKKAPGQEENLDAPLIEQIPAEYHSDTKLTATIDKSPQELNFALPQ